jgi:ferrous iron transport protein A
VAETTLVRTLDVKPAQPVKEFSALGSAPAGFRGRVQAIEANNASGSLPSEELEARLLELGFLEGAVVEILHEGAFGRDPIAVRVDNTTIALRRREAMAIMVESMP